jgi:imidazolonepropionase-like amidohydrolase
MLLAKLKTRVVPRLFAYAMAQPAQHNAGRSMRVALKWGCLAALLLITTPIRARQLASLPPGLAPFVSVNAPIVALTHVRIVDGTEAPVRNDQTLVISGDRIASIGPFNSTRIPPEARVLDLSNHTVLPGLVGLHEHTYFGGVARVTPMNGTAPLLYLAYGVTTAMTAGSMMPLYEVSLKRAVDTQRTPGPRFLIAGPYLDGDASRNPMSLKVATPEAARRAVAYWAGEGATWIKFLGAETRAVLGAAIEEAHARGLHVTGHLCSVTFTEAAALGIDLLQHGFITNTDYIPGKQPDVCPPGNQKVQADVDVTGPEGEASIRTIVEHGTAVVSTLSAYESFIPDHPLDPRALDLLAPDTRTEVEAIHADLPHAAFNVPPRLLQKMMVWERMFVAAGGLLGSGVDPWGTGLLPGVGDLRNYELLIQAGFAPAQVIQIMTLNGARILGEDDRIGSITTGKRADLFVVFGDPITTPSDIYNVVTVFREGLGYDSLKLRDAAKGRVGVN